MDGRNSAFGRSFAFSLRALLFGDEMAQHRIDAGLVSLAARLEEIDDILVQPDRDRLLLLRNDDFGLRPVEIDQVPQSGSSRMARSISASVMASTRAQSVRLSPRAIFSLISSAEYLTICFVLLPAARANDPTGLAASLAGDDSFGCRGICRACSSPGWTAGLFRHAAARTKSIPCLPFRLTFVIPFEGRKLRARTRSMGNPSADRNRQEQTTVSKDCHLYFPSGVNSGAQ